MGVSLRWAIALTMRIIIITTTILILVAIRGMIFLDLLASLSANVISPFRFGSEIAAMLRTSMRACVCGCVLGCVSVRVSEAHTWMRVGRGLSSSAAPIAPATESRGTQGT